MNTDRKPALAIAIAVASSLGVVGLANAQTPPAAPQAQDSDQLSEIIVTARRVEERLEDVPLSITVFSQAQLTDRNVVSAADLATYTPSLGIDNTFGNDNGSFVIRGFHQDSGTSPTVAVYFNDVVAPRSGIGGVLEHAGDGAGPGSFFDLQNVQVVKGPTGTLNGRNTTGGALLLVPQKPTSAFGGYVEAAGGNYGMEHTQAVLNLPFSDKVRLRLGFDQETRRGYEENVGGVGPSAFNNIRYIAGRAGLVVDITDNIENYLLATYSESHSNGPETQLFACNPAFPLFGQLTCAQFTKYQGNPGYNVENDLADAGNYIRQWQVSNTTTWNATDNLSVKNIASFAQYKGTLANNLFGNQWTIPAITTLPLGAVSAPIPVGPLAGTPLTFTASGAAAGHNESDQSTFTEELQLHGNALDQKLDWQTGFYFEGSHPMEGAGTTSPNFLNCGGNTYANYSSLKCTDIFHELYAGVFAASGLPAAAAPLLGDVQTQVGSVVYRDYAVYGQATYKILDQLKITAGVRETWDSSDGNATRNLWSFPTPGVPVHSCLAGVQNLTTCYVALETSSRAPTWLIDIDYTPFEDFLTYAKYARGYRAGGVVLGGVPGYVTFQPEKVDNYELGIKQSFRGAVSGYVNADVFYNDFSNQQLPIGFIVPPGSGLGAPSGSIANVGKSRIYGFELETALKPIRSVEVDLSYTWLDTRIESVNTPAQIAGSPDVPTVSFSKGSQLIYTPRNKASGTLMYQLPVAQSLGEMSLSGTYTYNGSFITGTIGPYDVNPSYSLLNFNANWRNVLGKPFDAELFVTNATNKFYSTNVQDFTNILGFAARSLGEPRMYGARLRYRF